jgi:hypothetical protein
MDTAQLVQRLQLNIDDVECLVEVFSRPNGTHFARTAFSSDDVIINEGSSCEEVLLRHRELLPLAIRSRNIRCATTRTRGTHPID